ncbi:MAG TPA: PLP-dependent aminotransferase family protein [Candidatus Saccharimonadales bacterium]|nr:PLP-dependent aminotransferase family protein [Candidatus Saccharimonadales bacterium]
MKADPHGATTLYDRVAESIRSQIRRGSLRPGDRMPSLRRVSTQQRVSMTTAIQAYRLLENQGHLEARPKSGFFVRVPPAEQIPEPRPVARPGRPAVPVHHAILREVIAAASDPENTPFGAACLSPELYPNRRLNLILKGILGRRPLHSARYTMPPGAEDLRRQIARRSGDMGCSFGPEDVTITSGALEAINVAIRAVLRPGHAIAVESPTFFGILQAAASMGMKVVEIPTDPRTGMDLAALAGAIRRHRIKACVVMTNCHNPLGYVLPDEVKKALVELTARHGVALIEDDIYGDLVFEGPRPRTAKSYDREGLVLLCSSYSKILAPGFRVGWIAAGRFRDEVNRLKFIGSIATPTLSQLAIAEFLESGGYDRHLRRLRAALAGQLTQIRHAAARYFPEGTRISRPAGGHMLWVELPGGTDAIRVYRRALAHRISVLPGPIFAAGDRYRNCLRLNGGYLWSEAHERALLTLGTLCREPGRPGPTRGAKRGEGG